jgi:hypothetical protein
METTWHPAPAAASPSSRRQPWRAPWLQRPRPRPGSQSSPGLEVKEATSPILLSRGLRAPFAPAFPSIGVDPVLVLPPEAGAAAAAFPTPQGALRS